MSESLFLLEGPSFLEGMSRALDLGDTGTDYNSSPNGAQADHAASWADWEMIASDLRSAAHLYISEVRSGRKEAG
jgi:hypothetical protein